MACFLAPVAEAIVVSVIEHNAAKKELVAAQTHVPQKEAGEKPAIPTSRKLGWLSKMLWGGSFLLAVEHIWHGEVVPWPPFLTAMNDPAAIQPMLTELVTVGGIMMLVVTAAWLAMVYVAERIAKREALALKEG